MNSSQKKAEAKSFNKPEEGGVTHRRGGTTDGADYRLAGTFLDIDVEYLS